MTETATSADPRARAMARHARNTHGECDECSQGYEFGGAPWPCPTWLDLETEQERADREAAQRQAELDAHVKHLVKHYRAQTRRAEEAVETSRRNYAERAKTAAELVELLGGNQAEAARLLGTTEIAVHNNLAEAAGVLHGMATPG